MAPLKAGDRFPEGVKFTYIPSTDDKVCGSPIDYDASKEFKEKKVVIVSVPGAFTPTCSERRLLPDVPGFFQKLNELKAKGIDTVAIIAYNDAWVMSAWGKAYGLNKKRDDIIFLSDVDSKFSASIGWGQAGGRTGRYAVVINKGIVEYAEKEPAGDVSVSGVDAVLASL
ncbi:MAG: hypothetical protein M1829_003670 [Trizodia sp. TS-e1964]|nr:MAG: hypothetical protein M1829_003670 [Trizodia sp. TS-e1964]